MLIEKCRISGSKNLKPILDLGHQPLANSLKSFAEDNEEKFPLRISFCEESSLVQLDYTINKKRLFDKYIWVTGTSETANAYADRFCNDILAKTQLKNNDLIIEIASNDGTFLKPFIKKGFVNTIGVDPAKNIAEKANKDGIKTIAEFWNYSISNEIKKNYGAAKIVFARNVIPHVSELHDVTKGIKNIIDDNGIGVIEFHYAGKILKDLQYDSIYHEHLCYFSIKSITYLLNLYGLYPFDIFKSPISGGSLVILFSKNKKNKTSNLVNYELNEKESNINSIDSWKSFAKLSHEHKIKTINILRSLKGQRIIGFGSSARSQTYINYCSITSKQIKFIIDNNPLKQNLFTPGSSIPIVSLEKGLAFKPDYIFIFAWNFKDEIMKICRENNFNGKFILPFPNIPKEIE